MENRKELCIPLYLATGMIILMMTSCTPYTYRYKATSVNAPMFSEKGDFEVNLGGNPEIGGGNAAVAITDHFGIGAGFSFSERGDSISIRDTVDTYVGDVFLGDSQADYNITAIYFNEFKNSLQYEVQLGFAYDERTEKIDSDLDRTNTSYDFESRKTPIYTRLYLQPAIGRNGKYVDWNFATRIQLVSYKDLEIHYPNNFTNYSDLTIEPVLTVRGGYRFAKLMLQVGTRIGIPNGPYDYVPIHLGGAISFPINRFTRRAK